MAGKPASTGHPCYSRKAGQPTPGHPRARRITGGGGGRQERGGYPNPKAESFGWSSWSKGGGNTGTPTGQGASAPPPAQVIPGPSAATPAVGADVTHVACSSRDIRTGQESVHFPRVSAATPVYNAGTSTPAPPVPQVIPGETIASMPFEDIPIQALVVDSLVAAASVALPLDDDEDTLAPEYIVGPGPLSTRVNHPAIPGQHFPRPKPWAGGRGGRRHSDRASRSPNRRERSRPLPSASRLAAVTEEFAWPPRAPGRPLERDAAQPDSEWL